MVTESKNNDPLTPDLDEGESNVDPERLAAVRMPTGFLKWVLSTPLPKEDKEDLWLDTLPPGSKKLKVPPPPAKRALPPWVFAALVTFLTAAVVTGLAFFIVGAFDSSPEDAASTAAAPSVEEALTEPVSNQLDPEAKPKKQGEPTSEAADFEAGAEIAKEEKKADASPSVPAQMKTVEPKKLPPAALDDSAEPTPATSPPKATSSDPFAPK